MKNNHWVCSKCDMKSTRRGNVLRHIKNKHSGTAEALRSMLCGEKSSSGTSPPVARATRRDSNFHQLYFGGTQQIVDAHVEEVIQQRLATLHLADPIGYEGYVCDDCLTIDINPIGSSSKCLWHSCNTLWLIDHQQLVSQKYLVNQYLQNHLAVFLAKGFILSHRTKGEIELGSYKVDESYFTHTQEYTFEPPPGADLSTLEAFAISNRAIASKRNPRNEYLKPIELGFHGKDHWANRTINDGKAAVSQEELISFVRVCDNRTASAFKTSAIEPEYYLIKVDL